MRPLRPLVVAFVAAVVLLTGARPALADGDDEAVTTRLAASTRRFDAEERGAMLWYSGWSAFFLTAAAGQAVFAVDTDDRELRATYGVGAVAAGIGLVTTIFLPPADAFAPARLRAMPTGTPEERKRKLDAADSAMARAAGEQRLGQSWLAHVGGVLVNGAAGLVLWKGYGYASRGVSTFVVGMLVSEVKIFTQPTWAIGESGARATVSLGAWPSGASVMGTF